MTAAAWTMLLITWGVVISFTLYFFVKVVRTPPRTDDGFVEGAEEIDDISEHD